MTMGWGFICILAICLAVILWLVMPKIDGCKFGFHKWGRWSDPEHRERKYTYYGNWHRYTRAHRHCAKCNKYHEKEELWT